MRTPKRAAPRTGPNCGPSPCGCAPVGYKSGAAGNSIEDEGEGTDYVRADKEVAMPVQPGTDYVRAEVEKEVEKGSPRMRCCRHDLARKSKSAKNKTS